MGWMLLLCTAIYCTVSAHILLLGNATVLKLLKTGVEHVDTNVGENEVTSAAHNGIGSDMAPLRGLSNGTGSNIDPYDIAGTSDREHINRRNLAYFANLQSEQESADPEKKTFRAAVFDKGLPFHRLNTTGVPSKAESMAIVDATLKLYDQQAATASQQGVDILVFPEYGLYPRGLSYDQMTAFCEETPPMSFHWNPCMGTFENTEDHMEEYDTLFTAKPLTIDKWQASQSSPPEEDDVSRDSSDTSTPTFHNSFPHQSVGTDDYHIQIRLSCMARRYNIYIVANMGNLVRCDSETYPSCKANGHQQYNTNVAFSPNGTLVAVYHKYNLFFEQAYDTPKEPEHSYFDTPFGRVGTVICFDLLFKEPTITLLEEYGIDTLVFPTAWMNVLPYFSAVPFHQGFSTGTGVNLLGANLHKPESRFSGSGLYTPYFTAAFRNDDSSLKSSLLIADVPVKNIGRKVHTPPTSTHNSETVAEGEVDIRNYFTSDVFGDVYNFQWLTGTRNTLHVCHHTLCCHLTFQKQITNEHFALGAFRGLHTNEGTYFIEVCALVRCADSLRQSCGDPSVNTSTTHFDGLILEGNFSASYVFPMVVGDGVDPSSGEWKFGGHSITSDGVNKPLVSAIMFGRVYDLD